MDKQLFTIIIVIDRGVLRLYISQKKINKRERERDRVRK